LTERDRRDDAQEPASLPLLCGHVDLIRLEVHRPDGPVRLTAREARLLRYLAERPGQAVPREELLVQVWDYKPGVVSRTLDTTVRRLRRKVERDPGDPEHVLSEYGVGYRFAPVPPERATRHGAPAPIPRPAIEARLREALAEHRLVTLWGPGGIGKTTLAEGYLAASVGVARRADLGEVADPDGLVAAIAAALDLRTGLEDPAEALAEALAGWEGVLLLDEAEGVVGPLAELLGPAVAGPGLGAVLITSRHRLGLPEEVVVAVPPLSAAQAVALYRSRAARTGVQIDQGPVLDALVEALDRHPLALELAAAGSGLFSPDQQLARLEAGEAPAPGEPDGALRRAVDQSWERLEPLARGALSRLTLFRGAFSAEDAIQVLDGEQARVLDGLVAASMLQAPGDGRLRMLRLVRRTVQELRPPTEADRQAHGRWLVARATDLAGQVATVHVARALDELGERLPEILDLHRQSVDRGDGALAARLALAAHAYLDARGSQRLRGAILEDAVKLGEAVPASLRARLLEALAITRLDGAQDPRALELVRQASALLGQDPLELARNRIAEGRILRVSGRHAEAVEVLTAARRALEGQVGPEIERQAALTGAHLGVALHQRGRAHWSEALQRLQAAVTHLATVDPRAAAGFQNDLARMHLEAGRRRAAVGALRGAARDAERVGDVRMASSVRANLGMVLIEHDPEAAREVLERSLDGFRRLGRRSVAALVQGNLAWLDLRAGRQIGRAHV
jgi:DNA-binding winged helix-turn-helix (wHTH) protein/tetratricopeptide (TPR) repeat protein